jgi:hypothetical protein
VTELIDPRTRMWAVFAVVAGVALFVGLKILEQPDISTLDLALELLGIVPVALLLLKGLSLKEIAAIRVTTERTVRAQARSLYSKAGLTGRAALSAFFLEDLLAPISDAEPEG